MKLIASLLLAVALLFAPSAKAQASPEFKDQVSKATLAVYKGAQSCGYKNEEADFFGFPMEMRVWECGFKAKFVCTATAIVGIDVNYVGLTAGHCIDRARPEDYYVSETVTEKPVLHKIKIKKFENDDRYDYALFEFRSLRPLPYIEVQESGPLPIIGTQVLNVNFSLGLTKQVVEGPIVSGRIGDNESDKPTLRRRFLVQIPVSFGASGSALVDIETHKIVGLVEGIFPGTQMAIAAIPTSDDFINFLEDDSAGLKPRIEPEPKHQPTEAEQIQARYDKFVKAVRVLSLSGAIAALLAVGIIKRKDIKVLFLRIRNKFRKK